MIAKLVVFFYFYVAALVWANLPLLIVLILAGVVYVSFRIIERLRRKNNLEFFFSPYHNCMRFSSFSAAVDI